MKPRVIMADKDLNYLIPLESKIIEELHDNISLEVYTDEILFHQLFQTPQKTDVLIISEDLYSGDLLKHSIGHLFLLTEEAELDSALPNATAIFKYSNIKSVLSQIIGKVPQLRLSRSSEEKNKLVLITSACGGTGKTTVALGLCEYLAVQNSKHVLYINTESLQSFGHFMTDGNPINDDLFYKKISESGTAVYSDIKRLIRRDGFDYLPPLKAPLMLLNCSSELFSEIAKTAVKSGDYDFVILDSDSTFDLIKAKMIDNSDKVIVVTEMSKKARLSTDTFASNINGLSREKYIFVCNKYSSDLIDILSEQESSMKYSVDENVGFIKDYDVCSPKDFSGLLGIQRVAYLLM